MQDIVVLDAVVRGVAVGGFATLGVALAASPQPAANRGISAVFFLAAIGHVLDNCVALQGADGHAWPLTRALSIMGPGMFWAFALTLFGDERRAPAWRFVPPAASVVMALAAALAPRWCARPVWAAYNLVSILLVAHALLVIWRGWRGDLVEPRRRLRAPVMGAAAAYVLVVASQDLSGSLGMRPHAAPLLQAFMLAALAVAGALALLRLDPVVLGLGGEAARPAPTARQPAKAPADLDPAALARLRRAMDEDEAWRREDLSIGLLADQVQVPEHRLRRLINGGLGHRNFAAFVNERRIAAAKLALADPLQARKSISVIAYELGFGSLGPFNRAFKDATGMTPTAWRQGAPREIAPNSEKPLSI